MCCVQPSDVSSGDAAITDSLQLQVGCCLDIIIIIPKKNYDLHMLLLWTVYTIRGVGWNWWNGVFLLFSPPLPSSHPSLSSPFPRLDDIRVMVIVWRLRGNIIRTVLCWIVWHSVHSQQRTYVSSSYRFNRLGFVSLGPLRCAQRRLPRVVLL